MISVIVPVYNEEKTIGRLLDKLSSYKDRKKIEVVVVDGQSTDQTLNIAKNYPVKTVSSKKMKGHQFNIGARQSKGNIFVFLHADCLVDEDAFSAIERSIDKGFIGGCLKQKIKGKKIIYRFIEASGNIRAKLFKVFYGDQAIFVRRDKFFKLGGFDEVEILEDVLFSRKLKREGKTRILNNEVYTSERRWAKQGIVKTTFINWLVTLGFLLGFPFKTLKRIYLDIR